MGANITYPDGSVLTSSALTIAQANTIMQQLSLGMIGQTVSSTNSAVRIQWPTAGAPFSDVSDDVCYLKCVPVSDPYDRIRDRFNLTDDASHLEEQWNYTRAWRMTWCFYGPNSTDLARALRSALYQDYFTNALQLSQLFPVSDFPEPMRAPELIDGQWFERVDFSADIYEFVTETITRQTVLSVETIVNDNSGVVADFTVATT